MLAAQQNNSSTGAFFISCLSAHSVRAASGTCAARRQCVLLHRSCHLHWLACACHLLLKLSLAVASEPATGLIDASGRMCCWAAMKPQVSERELGFWFLFILFYSILIFVFFLPLFSLFSRTICSDMCMYCAAGDLIKRPTTT
jgi:hypothetical protein